MIKRGILLSVPFLILIALLSVYGFLTIAEGVQIPIHFNIKGEVDATADKSTYLLGMPALAFLLTIGFSLLPRLDPRKQNLQKSKGLYYAAWFGALSIITIIHGMLTFTAVTNAAPDMRWIVLVTAFLIIIVGNFMAKSRSNWFLGLRTPWTLTSEHAWIVANRLTGWSMVLTGLMSILSGYWQSPQTGIMTLIIGIIVSALAGAIISFFAWRNDPDKKQAV